MDYALRPFVAADAPWLIAQHKDHYRREEGFDDSFGVLVTQIVTDFLDDHDPTTEAGWLAHDGSDRVGHIFCVRQSDDFAKLRLFYVVEAARGTGVAQALLDRCLHFAKRVGYSGMALWTHESHRAAGRIYQRNGFTKIDAKPVTSFGVNLVEESWQITF